MGGAAVVAVTMRKERDLREAFIRAGAVNGLEARSLGDLQIAENMMFNRLKNRDVIREAAPGLLYWDDEVYHAMRLHRKRMVLMIAGAVAIVFIMMTYASMSMQK